MRVCYTRFGVVFQYITLVHFYRVIETWMLIKMHPITLFRVMNHHLLS